MFATALLAVALAAAAPDPELAQLCAGQAGCRVVARHDAGQAADGTPLAVIETSWPARNGYDIECNGGLRSLWLRRGTAADASWTRLLRLCNDGYGASGVGEDSITVEPGVLLHRRYGGSNWRSATTTRITLDPLPPRIAAIESDATVGSSPGCHRTRDDLLAVLRRGWLDPVSLDEEAELASCDFERPADYKAIPLLHGTYIDEAQRADLRATFADWQRQQIALGNCALEFQAGPLPGNQGTTGYLLHGRASGPVRVRALALDELHWLVGVEAPQRKPASSASWINDDRLELWLGSFLFTWPQDIEPPRQYGVRLADGQVFPGSRASAQALPRVQQWQRDGWRWLAIDFSPVQPDYAVFSASVVYGEGDGRSQGLMLGSSRIRFGKAASLGDFWNDYPYTCRLRDGVLVRDQLKPQFANPDHLDPLARED